MLQYAEYVSAVGVLCITIRDGFLLRLDMDILPPAGAVPAEESPVLMKTRKALDDYFAGLQPDISEIPICLEGSDFSCQVWQILREIPYGSVRTYGSIAREMAKRMGKEKMSAQAVGQAVGHNPVSVLIPCHRVVGARGKLTGYAWGIEKKKWLLAHEKWDGEIKE